MLISDLELLWYEELENRFDNKDGPMLRENSTDVEGEEEVMGRLYPGVGSPNWTARILGVTGVVKYGDR